MKLNSPMKFRSLIEKGVDLFEMSSFKSDLAALKLECLELTDALSSPVYFLEAFFLEKLVRFPVLVSLINYKSSYTSFMLLSTCI